MICVSLAEKDVATTLSALRELSHTGRHRCGLAEIRLDALAALPSREELGSLFAGRLPLIATCRPRARQDMRDTVRLAMLRGAIEAGATYVDVAREWDRSAREQVRKLASEHGCRLIVSHHDERGTPTRQILGELVDECFEAGAEIAKIACRVHTHGEAARLLALLDDSRTVLPVAMGEMGRAARLAAPLLGAPFLFASRAVGAATADGQPEYRAAAEFLERARALALGV